MAISILDAPNTQTMVKTTRPLIVTLDSDLNNELSFRYLLNIMIDNVLITSLEAAGNQLGVAHFDLSELTGNNLSLSELDSTGESIHMLLGADSAIGQAKKISFVFGEKFVDVNGNIVINEYPGSEYHWYQHNSNFNVFLDSYDQPYYNFNMRPAPNGDNHFMNSQRKHVTHEDDWGVIGALNFINTQTFTRPDLMGIQYLFFDQMGNSVGTYLLPYTPITPDLSTGTIFEQISFYSPLHWNNVRGMMDANDDVSKFDNAAYYEMYVTNSAVFEVNLSERVRVTKEALCQDRDYFQVGYENREGAWEYHTFTGRNTIGINYDRKEFTKLSNYWNEMNFDTEALGFGSSGGKRSYKISENVNISLNTDFLTEAEADCIYNMLQSPYVVVFANKTNGGLPTKYTYNARVTQRSQKIKKRRFDKKIQFTINIEVISADF